MNPLRQAAQQALEALEKTHTQPGCEQWQAERKASVALRAALAQQEQEPVAWVDKGSIAWLGEQRSLQRRKVCSRREELLAALNNIEVSTHDAMTAALARAAIAKAERNKP